MKIDRRGFLVASSSALVLGKTKLPPDYYSSNRPTLRNRLMSSESRRGTSRSTLPPTKPTSASLRPTRLTFKPMGQPLETQICVFVDPSKRSQTILGIGGALTDASAEMYAKLPAAKQREIMDAYFDSNKGIGYTLGTNQHPQLRFLVRQLHIRQRRRQGAQVLQRRPRQAVPHSIHQEGDRYCRREAHDVRAARGVRRHS